MLVPPSLISFNVSEIGRTLLDRYDLLHAEHEAIRSVTPNDTNHLEEMRALENKIGLLERTNDLGIQRFGELVRRNESLESKLVAAEVTHSQSLSTINSLKIELSGMRDGYSKRRSTGQAMEEEVEELRKALHENRALADHNERRLKDGETMRRKAEVRIGELESINQALSRQMEHLSKGNSGSDSNLSADGNPNLGMLYPQHTPDPAAEADVQRAMADLVADNTLLRHDKTEIEILLLTSRDECQGLKGEIDSLRASLGVPPRTPREGEHDHEDMGTNIRYSMISNDSGHSGSKGHRRPLSLVVSNTHGRTYSLTPSLTASIASSTNKTGYYHSRRDSQTPSIASSSHVLGETDVVSPRGSKTHTPILLPNDGMLSPVATLSPRQRASFGYRSGAAGAVKFPANPRSVSDPWQSKKDKPRAALSRAFSGPGEVIDEVPISHDSGITSPDDTDDTFSSSQHKYTTFTSPLLQQQPFANDSPPAQQVDTDGRFTLGRSNTLRRRELMLLRSHRGAHIDKDGNEAPPPARSVIDPVAAPQESSPRLPTLSNKPSLSGLGFHESPGRSTDRSGLGAPFSPGQLSDGSHSQASTGHDLRTQYLLLLLDHASKLLVRLRQADVPTLSKRLKKQHLPGDVSHLSASTVKTLSTEISEMRDHFRSLLEEEKRTEKVTQSKEMQQESAVTRKDFMLLLRLFKEMLADILDLRTTLNQVVLDPSSAHKLRETALATEQDDEQSKKSSGLPKAAVAGLGWIAAPITKLFAGASTESTASAADKPAMALKAPKLMPSASATTTHINVEFGGTGVVKRPRQTSPLAQLSDTLPDSPNTAFTPGTTVKRVPIQTPTRPAITLGDGTLRGGTVRQRPSLYGIFAGASNSLATGGPWALIGDKDLPPSTGPRLRATSSQYFAQSRQPIKSGRVSSHRRQTSTVVDAIIDQAIPEHLEEVFNENIEEEEGGEGSSVEREGFYHAPAFRRPRGLSDSSIRSAVRTPMFATPM